MTFTFGKPSNPAEPLLACPACFHVGAGRVRDNDRLECSVCHRVVVRYREPVENMGKTNV